MTTVSSILKESQCEIEKSDYELISFFKENGYCELPTSKLILSNLQKFQEIIDCLIKTESWRGGWEGKEEYMKYMKKFNNGANRLGGNGLSGKMYDKLLGIKATKNFKKGNKIEL